jgi:hypothetical protein
LVGRRMQKTTMGAIEPALVASLEVLQPYLTGQSAPEREPLAVLDELCNIDKHRHLHLVNMTIELGDVLPIGFAEALGIGATPGQPDVGTFEVVSKEPVRQLVGRAEIGRARHIQPVGSHFFSTLPQMNMNPRVALDVVFEQGPPAYGGSVFQLLSDISQTVENIVRAF